MSTRNVLAICLQKTWHYGDGALKNEHYRLITRNDFGAHIIATWLLLKDIHNEDEVFFSWSHTYQMMFGMSILIS